MTLERELHADLRAMLMANEPFEYAHLIKFERPSRPDSITGKVSTDSVRYTYLTDASRNIGFDDGSKDHNGVANGTQTYLANKVLKVSEVSESIEAKASNFTLTLDGNGLGASWVSRTVTVTAVASDYDLDFDDLYDPIAEGFREGDKVDFYNNVGVYIGSFTIHSFRSGNIVRFKRIDHTLTEGTFVLSGYLASEEIKSILLNKNLDDYASFINREVFIYKVYQQDGVTVGEPLLLFKGIISNVGFDDGDNGITVSWGLTSHWGDFAQVKGRISSDDFHRALDQNGNPQPFSALKPDYAYDKGFMHSETSLNILSKYVVRVEKQKVKAKNGLLGIGSKVKVKKYYVNEDRFTELDFQLQARAIPLHYGVRVTEGYPIFADTLVNDSATVYVVYVLGEGEMQSIYDVIIDDKSLICNDKGDFDARSVQTADETVDIVCRGRADRGDVLGGQVSTDGTLTPIDYYDTGAQPFRYTGFFANIIQAIRAKRYKPPTAAPYVSNGKGVLNGESIALNSPIDMTLDFFGGGSGQLASSQLMELAKEEKFKVQNDYWTGTETSEYWGPNHRLLDTAYVVAKFKIAEGETSIPTLEFIMKCKTIKCYNYDYSYSHYEKATGENPDNFALGSLVELRRSSDNSVLNASVQIIDKWTFVRTDGVIETRFRFSAIPNLSYVGATPTITKFYMKQGANNWTMTTFNHIEHSGTITEELSGVTTPVDDGSGGTIFPDLPADLGIGGDPETGTPPVISFPTDPLIFIGTYDTPLDLTTKFGHGDIQEY